MTTPRRAHGQRRGRGLRAFRVVLGVIVAATLVQGGAARAEQQAAGAPLGGYNGTAAASGVHAFYNAGDVIPLPPPVDLGAPDALATITSGPATYARASVLDPGDLLANPDALLALASSSYPGGQVPPYPYRVTVTSSSGPPAAAVSPAPGLDARVQADPKGSTATATTPAAQAPGLATFGAASAFTTTQTDGSSVTVHAVTKVSNLNVLGVVVIDSVTTDLTATSSGGATKLTGGTKVTGASLLGTPITIDADGIHGNGSGSPLAGLVAPLAGSLNDLLAGVGIHLTVATPVKIAGAGTGELASDGLRIDLELSQRTLPALSALVKAIPPISNPIPGTPSIEDLLQLAKARHLVAIEIARGLVNLEARPGFDASGGPTSSTSPTDLGVPGAFDGPSPGGSFVTPTLPVSTPGGPGVAPTLTSGPPTVPKAFGIGSLVLLALLSLPFIGDRLAFGAGAILAADPTDACPLEER